MAGAFFCGVRWALFLLPRWEVTALASKRIQGITVEIGGDTSKLTAALKDVDRSLSTTQGNLRDVNKLLKLDPGNTELLAQKHRLLGDAIKETKERLETLKTAASQANEALAKGEISQNQYDALQREIIETENKLKSLEEQASKSAVAIQKIGQTGESLKQLGNNISGAGEKLLPVTGAVTALGTAAVKTAADFDSAMSQVAAVSGATGDELEQLREKAREMGSRTKFSASEAAEAMNYMAMAGWKTSDMLSGIEGIMNLAAASGEDLATTSDIVTDALTAFGLTAADSGHFADILAAASSNANTNVSMMGETFKYCAPIAGALGFSAEDTAEAIGLMANAGIKSTQAGTAMRTMMNNLAGEVKFTGASFGEMEVRTTNADGSMRSLNDILADCRVAFGQMSESEKAANAEALVGKNAMSGFLAVMNAAPADIDKLSAAIENCDGKSQQMADVMQDNLSGQLTILKSQLQELAISFGEILIPVIRDVVSFIQKIIDKLNAMDPKTKETIVRIAAIAAAIGPVLIVIGKIVSAVGTILTILPAVGSAISAVTGVFGALNAVMLANPIGLVIAAIVALVATFAILWNKCDGFREFWINLWTGIKDFFAGIWEGIKSIFSGVLDFIKNNWQGLLLFLVNPVAGAFKLIYDNCEGFRNAWDSFLNAVKNIFTAAWDGIKSFFSSVWEGIKSVASGGWEFIKSGLTSAWEGIKSVSGTVWNGIKSTVSSAWDGIKSVSSSGWESIKSGVSSTWETIKSKTSETWSSLKEGINSAWENIKSSTQTAASSVKDTVSNAWSGLKDFTHQTWSGIKDTVTNIATNVKDFVQNTWSSIKDNTSQAMSHMKDRVVEGWNAIKSNTESLWGNIKDKVVSIAGEMKEKFSSTIHNVAETFTNNLNTMKEKTSSGLQSIASTIGSKLSDIKSNVTSGLSNLVSSVASGMSNMVSTIKEKVSGIGQAFMDVAKNAFSWGKDIISNLISGIGSMIGSLVDKVRNVASTIKDYLGFSEPEKGPLSNFHTYMPDMIDLMGKGIEGNLGKLKGPMSDLASAIIPGTKGTVTMQNQNGSGQGTDISGLTAMLSKYLPQMANRQIVLDSGILVGELTDGINRQLGKAYV